MGPGGPEFTLAKIEVPISKSDSARVVDAMLDLFSPLTETLGALGDQARLFRTRSVLQALAETKRLADAAGLKLKQPPLKFLLPYLEGASKEEPEDAELRSMWANLLLQASTQGKDHPLFVEILSRLTSKDAGCLEKIVRNPRIVRKSVNQIQDAAFTFDRYDRAEDYIDQLLESMREEEVISKVIDRVEDRGTIVTSCGFYSIGADGAERDVFDDHLDFPSSDEMSLHALSALGLVRYPCNVVRKHDGGMFILTVCVLTELGAEFYLTTHAPELRNSATHLSRYEEAAAA